MLTKREIDRIESGECSEEVTMTEDEVVTAMIFAPMFKVIVATLTKRDADGKQKIRILGFGENGLNDFKNAMKVWKRQKKQPQ